MSFGSLVPGMSPMAIPQMKSNGMQAQGMNILKAALAQQAKGMPGGAPGVALPAPMDIKPEAAGGTADSAPGLLGALMRKLKPQAMGPIDPNTGLPVTQDVLAGAAQPGLPDMGGMGPAPTAITGLW